MAENRLETRILLRYATYTQWMTSEVILQPGEAAVAIFPDSIPTKPPKAIGVKIGDGRSYFDELPWIQGIAADVYNWAKEPNKPNYNANEIVGLAEYIENHSGGSGGGTASTGYRIVYNANTQKYTLQYFDETENDWIDTSSVIDVSTILNRINTIERWANGARTQLGNIEVPIIEYIYEEVMKYLNLLDYEDLAQPHEFITSVTQVDGKITVTRSAISASDIQSGVLDIQHGGIGINTIEEDEVLVGTRNNTIGTKRYVTIIENDRDVFATVGAIKDYVAQQTAGLTSAMHFIGESSVAIIGDNSRVDPQIREYNFSNAQPGDVILANNAQEFVWTGSNWRLLGDEGSYAIKGGITNADIAEEANIAQSKIADLDIALEGKVDVIEGKGLSSNDYTDDEKEKLENIENNAQVNVIEHIFLNNDEILPSVVNNQEKSIDLHFNGMSAEQGQKLDGIEAGAQVNTIESIKLNGTTISPDANKAVNIDLTELMDKVDGIEEGAQVNTVTSITLDGTTYTPNEEKSIVINSDPHTEHINKIEHIFVNGTELTPSTIENEEKSVNITIDESALTFQILKGARYPASASTYADIDIDSTTKKLELSHIAATGDAQHLLQTQNTYIVFDCGTSNSDRHPAIL